VPVKGPRRDTVAGSVAISRFFPCSGAGKGDDIIAFWGGDAKSGVFPFRLDTQTWRRAHALARHPNYPSRPLRDAVASVCHHRAAVALVQLDASLAQREKERGEELMPTTEAATVDEESHHRRRGSSEISVEGEGGRGAPATSAGSCHGQICLEHGPRAARSRPAP
jgi:hypothetical protein